MIISKINFSKPQTKAEFKNLDDSESLSSDLSGLRTSTASLTLSASMASKASKALFHQRTSWPPGPDSWIIPGTKMTNTGPFLWHESSKIQFFTDILYPFCL